MSAREETPAVVSLRTHGKSFYWAGRLLGAVHGMRSARLYAFCREVDDLADTGQDKNHAAAALDDLEARLISGRLREAWLVDAACIFREAQIPIWIPLELIRGARWDVASGLIRDEAELLRYAFQVAGTVGLMMSRILDVSAPAALDHAIDLGIAMQLTNIARDVPRDAGIGRRYLPEIWLPPNFDGRLDCPSPRFKPDLCRSVLKLLDVADLYYESGLRGLSFLPLKARGSILLAARLYRAIGLEIRKRGGDCWSGHVFVDPQQKMMITAQTLKEPLLNRCFWQTPPEHDANLHRSILGFKERFSWAGDGTGL